MSCSKRIIIFVKAPVPGKVKTRLVPALSYENAAELYRAWAREVFLLASRLKDTYVEIAYDRHPQFPTPDWLCNGGKHPDYFLQSHGILGHRLTYAFSRAFTNGARQAMILGSDSPGLPLNYLLKAFDYLKCHDLVLGPSYDGGYYLIGLRGSLRPELFQNISWSSSQVLSQTLNAVNQIGLSHALLPKYFDIDTFQDLALYNALCGDCSKDTW